MRLAERGAFYLLPRVAKICEIAGTTSIALSALFISALVITKKEDHWLFKVSLVAGGSGALMLFAKQILRVPAKGSNLVQKIKLIQFAVLLVGGAVGLIGLSMKQRVFEVTSAGLLGSLAASHLALKLL